MIQVPLTTRYGSGTMDNIKIILNTYPLTPTEIAHVTDRLYKIKSQNYYFALKRAKLTVALDDLVVAKGINEVGKKQNHNIPVYVDIDTGLKRMGRSPKESVQSILEIAQLPYIDIKGLMSHAGHADNERDEEVIKQIAIKEATSLQETKEALEQNGLRIEEISIGATPTARFIDQMPFITEARPGT